MPTLAEAPRVDLGELLGSHDVVGVGEDQGREYIVVAPRDARELATTTGPSAVDLTELGSSMPSPWTAFVRMEYNEELRGLNGLRLYDKMRRNDGTVRGTLRLVKTPVLAANWYMKPAGDTSLDKKKAEFAWRNLTKWQETTWAQFLTECLLCLDFGYYFFEKCFARGEDVTSDPMAKGKVVWKKFAPRHPMDVKEWAYDEHGVPYGVVMYNQGGPMTIQNGMVSMQTPLLQEQKIPYEKLVVVSFDKEGGNVEGISILRTAYKHWYYKEGLYKIDAIQKERHGIGVPIIKLPVSFKDTDKRLADELGRNLRTNERAHIVLPPGWELLFAKLEGQPVNALESADHHDKQIRANVLAPFMDTASTTKEEDQAMFLKGTRFIADVVIDTINKHAIPQLIDYNWSRTGSGYPELKARRIGEQADWRTMSFAVRNYVGAGIIVPDDKLEEEIREEMGLPPADPSSARVVATPQNPGADGDKGAGKDSPVGKETNKPGAPKPSPAKPPRQAPQPKVGPPASSAGRDKSGGS
jgi:hypothetical protein